MHVCRLAERRWLLSCRWWTVWSVLSKETTSSVWHTAPGTRTVMPFTSNEHSGDSRFSGALTSTLNPLITCRRRLRPLIRLSEASGETWLTTPDGQCRPTGKCSETKATRKRLISTLWEAEEVKRTEKATVKSKRHNSDNFRFDCRDSCENVPIKANQVTGTGSNKNKKLKNYIELCKLILVGGGKCWRISQICWQEMKRWRVWIFNLKLSTIFFLISWCIQTTNQLIIALNWCKEQWR